MKATAKAMWAMMRFPVLAKLGLKMICSYVDGAKPEEAAALISVMFGVKVDPKVVAFVLSIADAYCEACEAENA